MSVSTQSRPTEFDTILMSSSYTYPRSPRHRRPPLSLLFLSKQSDLTMSSPSFVESDHLSFRTPHMDVERVERVENDLLPSPPPSPTCLCPTVAIMHGTCNASGDGDGGGGAGPQTILVGVRAIQIGGVPMERLPSSMGIDGNPHRRSRSLPAEGTLVTEACYATLATPPSPSQVTGDQTSPTSFSFWSPEPLLPVSEPVKHSQRVKTSPLSASAPSTPVSRRRTLRSQLTITCCTPRSRLFLTPPRSSHTTRRGDLWAPGSRSISSSPSPARCASPVPRTTSSRDFQLPGGTRRPAFHCRTRSGETTSIGDNDEADPPGAIVEGFAQSHSGRCWAV